MIHRNNHYIYGYDNGNPPQLPAVYYCDCCGGEICEGEGYYKISADPEMRVCLGCADYRTAEFEENGSDDLCIGRRL